MQDKTTFNQEGAVTSGAHLSYWLQTAPHLEFSVLDHDIETDVLIVGGGISGLTTAYYLLEYGLNIVLIDDGYIGSGESGRTTAHITCMLDEGYYKMETLFGKTKARKIAESHSQAINDIEHIIAKEKISCAFRRVDGYLFPHESDSIESLEREYNSIKNAGIEVGYLDNTPFIPSEINMPCLKIPNQGQFHIIRYLRGLAASIIQKGGEIFTQTKAIQIDALGTKTQEGNYIRSKNIVVATHSPINNTVKMHTKQFPYRTYVIGGLIPKGSLPYALWWDTGDQNSEWQIKPYHYVRVEEYDDGNDVLLIGGEDHKTGQAEEEQLSEELRYTNLIEWAKVHFPIFNTIDYRWSGQIMEPVDGLAFLGKNPGDDNTYIITGDSGNGITYSTIGAKLIADMIKGIPNPYQDIYDPSRFSINKLSDYINEIANMAYQYKDWFQSDATAEINNIKKDEAAIISLGLKKLAIYRDLNDEIHSFSAVCTHLGCIVRWNGDEKTFDCPCHGSRFNINGEVINGPAINGLKKLDLKSDKK